MQMTSNKNLPDRRSLDQQKARQFLREARDIVAAPLWGIETASLVDRLYRAADLYEKGARELRHEANKITRTPAFLDQAMKNVEQVLRPVELVARAIRAAAEKAK
jgi:uncharacterized membrane protein